MYKLIKTVFLGGTLLFCQSVVAQEKPRFWDDVQAIKAYDMIYTPPANPILFIGSSSIRLWVDFNKTFKDYTVLNRGIGGAFISDTDRYLDDLVLPYHPKQLVIYVGENDLGNAQDGDAVFEGFKTLYTHLRAKLPDIPMIYLSIKGSPSRTPQFAKGIRANQLTKAFLKDQKNIKYIEVAEPILDAKGKMQPELFKEDCLHMNASGYQIWNKLLMPELLKD
ncbi:GDSL-type esterase/lipase family protein [Pedobacter sp. AW31-3R]|uniref:GDSL-type esterase/lipase family protein n=1 Tax=Pedobacter sp. AW31-3R TaxID=3445781 RepID=UPI003F9F11B4